MRKILLLFLFLPSIIFGQEKVGINTELPKATLDVNGDVIISKTEELKGSDNRALYVDSKGLVGVVPKESSTIGTPIFYAVAENTNIKDGNASQLNAFNRGGAANALTINVLSSDIIHNTVGVTVANNSFVVGESGFYAVSSALNFIFGTSNPGNEVFIFTGLRKKEVGSNSWSTITGNRPVIVVHWHGGQGTPIILPTVIEYLKKGDQLQFYFYRTQTSAGGSQGNNLTRLYIANSNNVKGVSLTLQKL